MAPKTEQPKKTGMIELVLNYFSTTPPILLLFHLAWLIVASCALSSAYILAFHFTSVVSIYREAHSIREFGQNIMVSSRQDQAIGLNLQRLLESSGANRAYVYRYHNGLAAINGVPFFFQTMTHEVISPGTSRVMQFEQRIPASINIAMSNQFVQNRCGVVDHADSDRDSQNYWYFQHRGARSLVRCPIFMQNGDLFGFVGVDYTGDVDDARLLAVADTVRDSATAIGALFAAIRR